MMKTFYIILKLLLFSAIAFGQTQPKIGVDCNPHLNSEECIYFRNIFSKDTFNFSNKHIGFATNNGFKIWGFENSFMPISKKEYFDLFHNDTKQNFNTKLIILDSNQKEKTKGFDAIILAFNKKYQKKVEESKFKRIITVFGYRELNYPDNLDLVGNDTSSILSQQDASFLNQIFKHSRGIFDFNGKKIGVVRTQTRTILSKSEFIDKVKKHLNSDFLYPYDFLYILNDNEKKDSGGYDALIIYDCLKCSGRDAVAIMKNNGT